MILRTLKVQPAREPDTEIEKLDRWADDRRDALQAGMKQLHAEIKAAKREAQRAPNLPEKLRLRAIVRTLEKKREATRRDNERESDAIEAEKDRLLDGISARLDQTVEEEPLFTIRWSLR